jgi:hypothetical protein
MWVCQLVCLSVCLGFSGIRFSTDCQPPADSHLFVLRKYFGHKSFKPYVYLYICRGRVCVHVCVCVCVCVSEHRRGHMYVRRMQWSLISSILNDKRDVLCVMATGKSL